MLKHFHLSSNYKLFGIGLLTTLVITFIVCGVIGAGHVDKGECIRAIVSTSCVIAQRSFSVLTTILLASLFTISIFGLIKHWSSSALNNLLVLMHWQLIFREIAFIKHDFLQKAFRRGIIHGQIYNLAYITR